MKRVLWISAIVALVLTTLFLTSSVAVGDGPDMKPEEKIIVREAEARGE